MQSQDANGLDKFFREFSLFQEIYHGEFIFGKNTIRWGDMILARDNINKIEKRKKVWFNNYSLVLMLLWLAAYGYSASLGRYAADGSSSLVWLTFCCFAGQLIWLWFFRKPGIDILLSNGPALMILTKNTAFNNQLHQHIYDALETKSNFIANYTTYTIDNCVFVDGESKVAVSYK